MSVQTREQLQQTVMFLKEENRNVIKQIMVCIFLCKYNSGVFNRSMKKFGAASVCGQRRPAAASYLKFTCGSGQIKVDIYTWLAEYNPKRHCKRPLSV